MCSRDDDPTQHPIRTEREFQKARTALLADLVARAARATSARSTTGGVDTPRARVLPWQPADVANSEGDSMEPVFDVPVGEIPFVLDPDAELLNLPGDWLEEGQVFARLRREEGCFDHVASFDGVLRRGPAGSVFIEPREAPGPGPEGRYGS